MSGRAYRFIARPESPRAGSSAAWATCATARCRACSSSSRLAKRRPSCAASSPRRSTGVCSTSTPSRTPWPATRAGPGLARLKAALRAYRPRPDRKSELERGFDAWLLEHPEIPEPSRNVYIDGWEIDCWWPEQRVVLELDGRDYHTAVQEMERDRLKDTKLQIRGIKPMRVTGERWDLDRAGVRSDLLALLQLG
jgi:hypothetical protein